MDLTTLAPAIFLALGLIGCRRHRPFRQHLSEITAAPAMPGEVIDQITECACAGVQINKYQQGVDRMRRMTRDRPPKNKVLLARPT
jgi:hypothetical protein